MGNVTKSQMNIKVRYIFEAFKCPSPVQWLKLLKGNTNKNEEFQAIYLAIMSERIVIVKTVKSRALSLFKFIESDI